MICLKCLSMFSLYTTQGDEGKHHANEAHLDRAATDGCKICIWVRREWLLEKRNLRTTSDAASQAAESVSFNYRIDLPEERGGRGACVFIRAEVPYLAVEDDDDDGEIVVAGVDVYRSASLPGQEQRNEKMVEQSFPDPEELRDEPWRVRHVGSLRTYPESTGHPDVAERASLWLNECLANHETCRALHGGIWHPQRLLDVRDPRRPRLVITDQEPVEGGYATLSHCWGEHPEFMTLCPQTEELLRNGVPVERLPQTFRDAILTTNRLGIAYLWIDSLCILQAGPGSEEDWVGHVTAMRQIYQSCTLNIAADRAANPHEGAFAQRHPDTPLLQSCQFFWDMGDGNGNMWTVVDDDLNGGFFDAPLTRRAWVFQERFLAPRVLHFGAVQAWWECADLGFASEALPSGMPRTHPHFDLAGAPFSIPQAPLPLGEQQQQPLSEMEEEKAWRDNVMNEWQRAVSTYAKARLTFVEKDVFAAFAGVAEQFGRRFYQGDEYLAGHFRSELPWCLLWECEGMRRRRPHGGLLPYRAPSWSWASMSNSAQLVADDTVGLPLCHACPDDLRQTPGMRVLAEVLDARVELVDEKNRFGAVEYAELTLRAKAFDCFRLDNHPALLKGGSNGGEEDEDDDDPASPTLNPSRVPHAKVRSPTSWGMARDVAVVAAPALFERYPYTRPFLTPYVEVEPDDPAELLGLGQALALPILVDASAGPRVTGILVRPVVVGGRGDGGDDGRRSYFERVGFFRVKGFDVDELVKRGVVEERDVVLV